MVSKKTTSRIIKILEPLYTAKGMVDLGNPEDTLIATLLSARTTDEQVLKVYPGLRKRFPRLQDFAEADVKDIESCISSIGLYHNKARAIKALAIRLLEVYDGQVPKTIEELITLPGVGRKTASCVLWYSFKIPAMAVDTHVFRIAHRLGWAQGKDPVIVEQELMQVIPQDLWGPVNRIFVQFGRDICKPLTPQCWRCPVRDLCPYQPKTTP
ncbi:endonuclease III [Patescibacteria group bacterium]|nr:endonuclease III [Patescibacteria group bacterium]MBP9710364.1 endonuclease III [Patescibacteria group bacterium]